MHRAQNIVEILLIAALVAVVTVSVAIMYNHQKTQLANMSKSNYSNQSVNLNTANAAKLSELAPYSKVETAGTSALTYLDMSSAEFSSIMANNVQYSELLDNPDGKGNILELGEALSSHLNLGYTFSASNVTVNTLSDLVGVLNAATSGNIDPQYAGEAETFKTRFNSLLDASTASKLSADANGMYGSPSSSNYNFSAPSASTPISSTPAASTPPASTPASSTPPASTPPASSPGITTYNPNVVNQLEVGGGYATAGHSTGVSSGGFNF